MDTLIVEVNHRRFRINVHIRDVDKFENYFHEIEEEVPHFILFRKWTPSFFIHERKDEFISFSNSMVKCLTVLLKNLEQQQRKVTRYYLG
jgi:hypothetical protein